MRRQEFFVPVGVLLKCFLEVSDRELSEKLMACCAEVSRATLASKSSVRPDFAYKHSVQHTTGMTGACKQEAGR